MAGEGPPMFPWRRTLLNAATEPRPDGRGGIPRLDKQRQDVEPQRSPGLMAGEGGDALHTGRDC